MTRNRPNPSRPQATAVRCAIYTRKSSEEGLEQEFNSLDAQRESGEAYIASQKNEGWVCLPEQYDDGGFTGGNMDRPAVKRLMADIEAGRIDCVVVYKVDRLSRSLLDFARMMETFERHKVSFVSVTQQFNTASSMGRLVLNVLLSFAQFEREIISERTRDKIAASRKKGIWTGGRPVLGYDIVESKLVVNPAEASVVRQIFGWYIECQSMRALLAKLEQEGITNKRWTTKAGEPAGGGPFSLSTLAWMLTNCLYIGRVPYKRTTFDGQHEAIVDPAVYQRVQEILQENRSCGASLRQGRYGGVLKGLLRCGGCGQPMVHTTTKKATKGDGQAQIVYRYYTCRSPVMIGKRRCQAGTVPAEQIEAFVVERVREALVKRDLAGLVYERLRNEGEARVRDLEALLTIAKDDLKAAEKRREVVVADEIAERAAQIGRELKEVREALPTRESVEAGVRDFEGLWRNLTPTERSALVAQVVRAVRFDSGAGEVSIEWLEASEEAAA